jgi:hypothetical protein
MFLVMAWVQQDGKSSLESSFSNNRETERERKAERQREGESDREREK